MIPVWLKEPIPADWAYPLSDWAVNEALVGTARSRRMQLRFDWLPPGGPEASREPDTLAILSVLYEHPETVTYTRNWQVEVYAVPQMHRTAARRILLAEVFPCVRDWVALDRPREWFLCRQRLAVTMNTVSQEIEFTEYSTWDSEADWDLAALVGEPPDEEFIENN